MLPSGINIRIREDLIDGASRSQTTLIIDPIITKDGHRVTMSDIGDIGFGKINQGNSNEELISWTGITDNTTTYTLTGCIWGYNFYNLTAVVANRKRHTSGATFSINTDMHYIEQQFVAKDTGIVTNNNLYLGDSLDSNKTFYAQNADANKPYMRYDKTLNKWIISNDGVNSYDPEAGGSGVTAGDGITITGGNIDINRLDTTTFVETSAGTGDDNKVPILSADGKLDESFINLSFIKKDFTAGEAISARDVVKIYNADDYTGEVAMSLVGESVDGANLTQTGTARIGKSGATHYVSYFKFSRRIIDGSFKFKLYGSTSGTMAGSGMYMYPLTAAFSIGAAPPASGTQIAAITVLSASNEYKEYTVTGLSAVQMQQINDYGFLLKDLWTGGETGALTFNDVSAGSNKPLNNVVITTDFTGKILKAHSTLDKYSYNIIGLADSALAVDEVGSVTMMGVVGGFTGLTPGVRYYRSTYGTMVADVAYADTGVIGSSLALVGLAVSSTELLLKIN